MESVYRRLTSSLFHSPCTRGIYGESICLSTCILVCNLDTITPYDITSLMASILHIEPAHKHTRSTFSVPASAHTLQPSQNASNVKLVKKVLRRPAPKNPNFFLVHTHTQIQAGGPSMWIGWAWWKEGIMCLTASLSDLSEAAEKQPGGRHPLTQMTNVHWAFPIPLLSAKTNASYSMWVCVCLWSDSVPQWHQINDTWTVISICFALRR